MKQRCFLLINFWGSLIKKSIPRIRFLTLMKLVSIRNKCSPRSGPHRRKHSPRVYHVGYQQQWEFNFSRIVIVFMSALLTKLPRFSVVRSKLIFLISPVIFHIYYRIYSLQDHIQGIIAKMPVLQNTLKKRAALGAMYEYFGPWKGI